MTVFLDASVLVAIISDEPGAEILEAAINAASERLTSAMAVWETTLAVARRSRSPIDVAATEVKRFCTTVDIRVVDIGGTEAAEAIHAYQRYGKSTGHAAKLNMGDCFAYACAKTNNARLLYKGDDFIHTDLA